MVQSAPLILVAIAIELGLAGIAAYVGLRLLTRRSEPTLVMGLFMLAITFGLVAIFSITFMGKIKSG